MTNTPNQPSLDNWQEKLKTISIMWSDTEREYVLKLIESLISQAKAQGAEEERKRFKKVYKQPLDYLSSWVKKLQKETVEAKGYTPGEKQIVLVNLNKIGVELKVARLIAKDLLTPQKEEA